jgi:uncharacterized protein YjbJ (UPF0337 family)
VRVCGADQAFNQSKEIHMNRDTLQGQWKQMKGSVKKQWGKLTDDDIAQVDPSRGSR